MLIFGYCSTAVSNAFCDRAAREKWQTTAFDVDQARCSSWVILDILDVRLTLLVDPDNRTSAALSGTSESYHIQTSGR
jgi:hypothetical protein